VYYLIWLHCNLSILFVLAQLRRLSEVAGEAQDPAFRYQRKGNTVLDCDISAIMRVSVETWFWIAIVRNTVSLLTSVLGVLGIVKLPAGKVSLETTRSGPTMLTVTMTELLVSMCAKLE
jgi:hypothetical protein